jgi:hypothetical protein
MVPRRSLGLQSEISALSSGRETGDQGWTRFAETMFKLQEAERKRLYFRTVLDVIKAHGMISSRASRMNTGRYLSTMLGRAALTYPRMILPNTIACMAMHKMS